MLDWQAHNATVAARDRHLHRRLPQPLSEDAVGVWRSRLSAMECFAVEACLYRELDAGSYDLRFKGRGWRAAMAAAAWLLRALAPGLRRGIPWLQRRGMLPRRCYL